MTVVYLVFCRPATFSLIYGFIVVAVGALIRLWAAGTIRKEKILETAGPYAYTRNPLYFGTFIMVAGFALVSNVWWVAILCLAYFAAVYAPVISAEGDELEQVFGEEYRTYTANVPILFPRFTPWKKVPGTFSFKLYLKNGEYNVAIGVLVAAAVLAARSFLF